jgi:hypothetical protein
MALEITCHSLIQSEAAEASISLSLLSEQTALMRDLFSFCIFSSTDTIWNLTASSRDFYWGGKLTH